MHGARFAGLFPCKISKLWFCDCPADAFACPPPQLIHQQFNRVSQCVLGGFSKLRWLHTPLLPRSGLDSLGILPASKKVFRNLSYPEIIEHERKNNEGQFTKNGTFVVDTGV